MRLRPEFESSSDSSSSDGAAGGERLNLAREKTGHRRSGAAVGDVDQFDPSLSRGSARTRATGASIS